MHRFAACFFVLLASVPAAKSQVFRYEVGVQFNLSPMTEVGGGGGFGATFHYNFNDHLALDSQLTYRRKTVRTSDDIGQTQFLTGIRAGQRIEDVGLFAHARAGFVHFGSVNGLSVVSRTTVPVIDLGGTLEHYHGPLVVRFELGELFVAYGNAVVPPPPPPVIAIPSGLTKPLGTRASPVLGFGFAVRF